jgi:hypothetical protein
VAPYVARLVVPLPEGFESSFDGQVGPVPCIRKESQISATLQRVLDVMEPVRKVVMEPVMKVVMQVVMEVVMKPVMELVQATCH